MKIMYEINWHNVGDVFLKATVTTITVTGTLPSGAIEAVGSDGRKFRGSLRDYHETEDDAWAEVKLELAETAEYSRKEIDALRVNVRAIEKFLEELK